MNKLRGTLRQIVDAEIKIGTARNPDALRSSQVSLINAYNREAKAQGRKTITPAYVERLGQRVSRGVKKETPHRFRTDEEKEKARVAIAHARTIIPKYEQTIKDIMRSYREALARSEIGIAEGLQGRALGLLERMNENYIILGVPTVELTQLWKGVSLLKGVEPIAPKGKVSDGLISFDQQTREAITASKKRRARLEDKPTNTVPKIMGAKSDGDPRTTKRRNPYKLEKGDNPATVLSKLTALAKAQEEVAMHQQRRVEMLERQGASRAGYERRNLEEQKRTIAKTHAQIADIQSKIKPANRTGAKPLARGKTGKPKFPRPIRRRRKP